MNKNMFIVSVEIAQKITKYLSLVLAGIVVLGALSRQEFNFSLGYVLGYGVGAYIGWYVVLMLLSSIFVQVYFAIKHATVEECVECLRQKEHKVAHPLALNQLARIKTPDALSALLEVTQDENMDKDLRKQALSAIRKAGAHAREHAPAIVDILGSGDKSLRKEAIRTLKTITGQNLGEDPEQWRQWLQQG